MAEHGGGGQKASLGATMENFIDTAIVDFTHMTVLIYLVREAKAGCTAGDVSKVIGDPKKVVQRVFDRFKELGMVRVSGGLLSKKYFYEREGPKALLVSKLLKLWEHRQGHEIVLKRVLAPK
jgi:hypothetical protein